MNANNKPSAIVAERALLASILCDPSGMAAVAEIVLPDDFQGASHRAVYEAMLELDADGQTIELTGLMSRLEGRVDGLAIGELMGVVPDFSNLEAYARRVREASTLRKLQRQAADMIHACKDPDADAVAILTGAEAELYRLTERQVPGAWVPIGRTAGENIAGIRAALAGEGKFMHAIPSGFRDLDRILQGFRPGDLCYLAARPSQGKTALALTMAYQQARAGRKVAFLSIEMSAEQLALRLQAAVSDVPLSQIRACDVKERIDEMDTDHRLMASLPLWVDDTGHLTPLECRAKLRRIQKEQGLDIAFVDYIGLMHWPERTENKNAELTEISKAMKALAKELKIPIVALSQLRRQPAGMKPQRPELNDLRDSGALEQDADICIFIHRIEQYLLDQTPAEYKGKAEIIVAKHRNGPTGHVDMAFIKNICKFADLAPEYCPAYTEGGRDLAAGKD